MISIQRRQPIAGRHWGGYPSAACCSTSAKAAATGNALIMPTNTMIAGIAFDQPYQAPFSTRLSSSI